MKNTKYKKHKRTITFFAAFILWFTTLTLKVNAQTSINYYKELFESWGIKIDILPTQKEKVVTSQDIKKLYDSLLEKSNSKDQQSTQPTQNGDKKLIQPVLEETTYLLMLDSQNEEAQKLQETGEISTYQKTIIITKDYPKDFLLNQNYMPPRILDSLEPKVVNGKIVYTIPQIYLTTPELQKQTADYFKALAKSEKTKTTNEPKAPTPKSLKASLMSLKESSLFESALYAVAILFIFAAFYKFFILLIQNPKRLLQKDLYAQIISRFVDIISRYHNALLLVFLLLVIFYIPVVFVLLLKFGIKDLSYLQKYIFDALNPLTTKDTPNPQNFLKLGLLAYSYALVVLFFVLLIPNFYKIFAASKQKIESTSFKDSFIKWLFVAPILLTITALAFFPLTSIMGFVSLSGVIVITTIWYMRSKQINYSQLFNAKEKFALFGLLFLSFALNIAWPVYKKSRPTKYALEPLIGIKDNVVMLPYSKKWGQNVLFEPHYYEGDSLIFADEYLVYAPNAKKIINKPLKDFAFDKNFIITGKNAKKFIEAALQKPELMDILAIDKFSPIFTIKDVKPQDLYDKSITFELTFNCAAKPKPTIIKLEIANLWKSVETQSHEVLIFPGCSQNTSPEYLQALLDPFLLPDANFIIRIRGIDIKSILDTKLYANNQEVKLTFINQQILNDNKNSIIYQNFSLNTKKDGAQKLDEVVNYATNIKKTTSFDTTYANQPNNDLFDNYAPQGFNISEPINALMKEKLLSNPFVIWSNKSNEIIKLEN